ncbi:MAG: DUF5677 domain-containing protein [Sulfobacillus sp.]
MVTARTIDAKQERPAHEQVRDLWNAATADWMQDSHVHGILGNGEKFVADVCDLFHRSVTRGSKDVVGREQARIFVRTFRRYFALIEIQDRAFTDIVADELRVLVELLFQAFFLLRDPDAPKVALDAINLSARSWYQAGEKLRSKGLIDPWNLTPEEAQSMEDVISQVFSRYDGIKAKFYADMSAQETAKRAGLEWVYEAIYSAMSSHIHNESITELAPLEIASEEERTYILNVIPPPKMFKGHAGILSDISQVAVVTLLGSLSGFANVDLDKASRLMDAFLQAHAASGWEEEIETIRNQWKLS